MRNRGPSAHSYRVAMRFARLLGVRMGQILARFCLVLNSVCSIGLICRLSSSSMRELKPLDTHLDTHLDTRIEPYKGPSEASMA